MRRDGLTGREVRDRCDLDVSLLPSREFARLADTARRRLAGEQIRSSRCATPGRRRTLELDANIAALPEHLEPGERLEAVAGATLEWSGLLVVTDRRELLSWPVLVNRQEAWSVARGEIRSAAAVEAGRGSTSAASRSPS